MRLVTRADFDGLCCAVLLTEVGVMDNLLFVHPKDVQDGKYPGHKDDVVANVPFIPGCGLWFDHHSSEFERLAPDVRFEGLSKVAPSCARVVWEFYGGTKRFGRRFDDMLDAVDRVDSGQLTPNDVLHPEGWVLLGFVMDPRTGLGRYRNFTISNYRLMEDLIGYCRHMPIEDVLAQRDVKERVDRYLMQEKHFRHMLLDVARVEDNVLLLDLRGQPDIPQGNRFTMYTIFPTCNISIQVMPGRRGQNTVFAVGHSIFNRTSRVDVGRLMLRFGGGGHTQVG
ncbi:MAG: exopolyphosphatase, partial [Desulfovibrionaceae bacterium]